jgi:hypothetical protein
MLATLEFSGAAARISFAATAPGPAATPRLRPVCETKLS